MLSLLRAMSIVSLEVRTEGLSITIKAFWFSSFNTMSIAGKESISDGEVTVGPLVSTDSLGSAVACKAERARVASRLSSTTGELFCRSELSPIVLDKPKMV